MLTGMSLRLRIVLIFAGLAAGVVALLGLGLWLAARAGQSGDAAGGLLQGALIAGGGAAAWGGASMSRSERASRRRCARRE